MKRRVFLKRAAAVPVAAVAVAVGIEATPRVSLEAYRMASNLRNAGLMSAEAVASMYRVDWPIGLVTFDKRAMLRLTGIVSV